MWGVEYSLIEYPYYCQDCELLLSHEEMEDHNNKQPEHNIVSYRIGADF